MIDQILSAVDDDQRKVVTYSGSAAMVLAGAGSGKTRCMQHRVAYLIESGVQPSSIFAISFTKKAAGELTERICAIHPHGSEVISRTFHSLCYMFMRQSLGMNMSLIKTSRATAIIRLGFKNTNWASEEGEMFLLKMFGSVKNDATPWNDIPDALQARASRYDLDGDKVVRIWRDYERAKSQENLIDFDDMIYKVWMELESPHGSYVLNTLRERIQHLIVDEAQDLNIIQLRMAELLGAGGCLMMVGDLRQSIYGFRGAKPTQVLDMSKRLNMDNLYLTKNYRSGKTLVNRGSDLIGNGSVERAYPRAEAVSLEDGEIHIIRPSDEYDEAGLVAHLAEELIDTGSPLHEIAVIYRTNAQSVLIQQALRKEGIPVYFVGGSNFFARKEIMDSLAYLKLAHDSCNVESFKRIYNLPTRYLGNAFLNEFDRLHDGGSVQSTLGQMIYSGPWKRGVKSLLEDLRRVIDCSSPTDMLDVVYDLESKLKGAQKFFDLYKTEDEEDSMRCDNLMALRSMAASFGSLAEFLDECANQAASDDPNDLGKDKVHLTTVHRSKGLEYDHTFVVGLVDGLLPHSKGDVQEERRTAYVAFTRARKRLHLMSPITFRDRAATPSMFIEELNMQ